MFSYHCMGHVVRDPTSVHTITRCLGITQHLSNNSCYFNIYENTTCHVAACTCRGCSMYHTHTHSLAHQQLGGHCNVKFGVGGGEGRVRGSGGRGGVGGGGGGGGVGGGGGGGGGGGYYHTQTLWRTARSRSLKCEVDK